MAKTSYTLSLSKRYRKTAPAPHKHLLSPLGCRPVRPQCDFFSRLPYDVRSIIYSYLQSSLPFGLNSELIGFYVSCRQAKDEMQELARVGLTTISTHVRNTTGIGVTIKFSSDNLRNVVAIIPHTAINGFHGPSSCPKWNREVLVGLHPLFSHPFDTLRLHISTDQGTLSDVLPKNTLLERARLKPKILDLLKGIAAMIDHVNRFYALVQKSPGHAYLLERVERSFNHTPGKAMPPYPTAEVKARRICISWDMHTSLRTGSGHLNGRLYHSWPNTICARPARRHFSPHDILKSIKRWKKARAEKKAKPLDIRRPDQAVCYRLHDLEYYAVEIGIASTEYWPRDVWGGPSVVDLVSGIGCYDDIVVSSKGLGLEMKRGAMGVDIKEYLEKEREVRDLLYTT